MTTLVAITKHRSLFRVDRYRATGLTAATVVRREFGRDTEIDWHGHQSTTGRVLRFDGAWLGTIDVLEGHRGE